MLGCVGGTFCFHLSTLLLLGLCYLHIVECCADRKTQLVENSQDRRHNLLKQTDVSYRPMTTAASTKIRRGVYSRQPQWKGRKSKYDNRVTPASEWKAYALLLGLMSCVKVDGKKFGGWLSFRMMMGFAIIREDGIFTTSFNQTVKGDVPFGWNCWMGWLATRVKFGWFGCVRFRVQARIGGVF